MWRRNNARRFPFLMMDPQHRPGIPAFGVFAVHQALGSLGVGFLAPFLVYAFVEVLQVFFPSTFNTHWAHFVLTEIPGFPVQAVLGFSLGLNLARWWKQPSGQWAWILPGIWFASLFVLLPISAFESRMGHFFGTACAPKMHCFDQIVATMPAIAAASYSLGTFVGLRFWPGQNTRGNGLRR